MSNSWLKKGWFKFILASTVLLSTQVNAQDDESFEEIDFSDSPFYVSGNFGGYFANSETAAYYDGSGEAGTGLFGINWIFSIQQFYDQIKNRLNGQDFVLGELPANLQYKAGFMIGGTAGVKIGKQRFIFGELGIVTLRLGDVFTIHIDDPVNFEPIIRQGEILGEEKRLLINLGYREMLGSNEQTKVFYELGGTLNSVEVTKNEIFLEGLNYNLLRPVNPNQPNTNPIELRPGGVNFGAFGSLGINYKLNSHYSFDVGASLRYERIDVDPALDPALNSQFTLFLRVLFR